MGAGPGGLAASMLLAAKGFKVDVYERLNHVGGRSGRIDIDGFRFDRGPTFFLYPEILRQIFASCGRNLDDEIELIRLDPQYHLIFENHSDIKATPNLARMYSEIARFSKTDAENLKHFIDDNRKKFRLFSPVLQQPFDSIQDLFSPTLLKALPLLKPFRSVDKDLQKYFKHPLIRLAFSFQSKYLGMSPFQCPSLFTILSYMEYEYGVFHPRGGCNEVMNAMARVAQQLGVQFHLNDPVQKLNFKGKRFYSVETKQGTQCADSLVVNADFGHFVERFVPQSLLKKWNHSKINRKQFSCSTFMMYLGIKGRYDHLEHHTIFLGEEYERFLAQIEQGGILPENPSIYIHNASVTDDSLAPKGCSGLYILVPVANLSNPVNWNLHTKQFRRIVLDRLKTLGLVDLEKRIVVEKIVTPVQWQSDLAIHHGATFNLSHCLNQLLLWRPNNRFEELESVYLVGGGTHPGSGLPVIFEGARITSELLTKDAQLKNLNPYISTENVINPIS